MKRLLVRLSLLSLLTAAGVFAIIQAQCVRGQGEPAPRRPAAPEKLLAVDNSQQQAPAHAPAAASSLIPLPAQLADERQEAAYVLPAPTVAIIRGNNDAEEETADETQTEGVQASHSKTQSPAAQPPAHHFAQNAGASSRARNPFARQSSSPTPAESPTAQSAPADEGAFPVASPTLAPQAKSEAATENQGAEYQEYTPTPDPGGAANADQDTGYGGYNAVGGQSVLATESPTPAALGAPRELAPYGEVNQPGGEHYTPATPIRGQESGVRGQESQYQATGLPAKLGGRGQESGVEDSGRGFSFERGSQVSSPAGAYSGAPVAAAGGVEGAGVPGPQTLEGAQTPSVTLKKIAPPEIQIGKPATFEIHVQNVGRIPAHQVIVKEEIPRGVRFIDAAPPASPQAGALLWELGTLQPGDTRQIKIQYLPVAEGDVGSIAVAAFQAQASVRTVCTRPQLAVEQAAPEKVLLGETFMVRIRLSNPGTGVATKVVLEEDVPEGFAHPSGRALEYEVGSLRPGETRDLDLTLKAAQPGVWNNALVVRGEGNLAVEKVVPIEIVAPQLEVAMTGPGRRYLDRQATYTVAVANPGTATANDVQIVGRLPKGMKFVAANNEGQYDPKTHAVVWALAELPPGQVGQVQLTALPVETGEQKIAIEGKGSLDTTAFAEHLVTVEAAAELVFEIADKADPIEVNEETLYEVKVTNKGSKTATNVRLAVAFPPEMKPLAGDGPARAEVADGQVTFEPLARLNPREEAIFRIQAAGVRPGDHRIQVQIVSDDLTVPITKEEGTRVYADQ